MTILDLIYLLGLLLVAAGTAAFSVPAGVIVLGLGLMFSVLLMTRKAVPKE